MEGSQASEHNSIELVAPNESSERPSIASLTRDEREVVDADDAIPEKLHLEGAGDDSKRPKLLDKSIVGPNTNNEGIEEILYQQFDEFPQNPIETANIFSRSTLSWMDKLIIRGSKSPLRDEDIWRAAYNQESRFCAEHFDPIWLRELERENGKPKKSNFLLERVIYQFSRKEFILSAVLFGVFCFSQFAVPYLVQSLIAYLSDQDGHDFLGITSGYAIIFLLFGVRLVSSLTSNISLTKTMIIAIRARNALIDRVYHKSLYLSPAAKQKSTTGETLTLMSVDTERIFQALIIIHWMWAGPIVVVVGICLLVNYAGVAALAAVGAMVLAGIVEVYAAGLIAKFRRKTVEYTEERIKLINEALRGIRVIKYYAWEGPVAKKVEAVRKNEVLQIIYLGYSYAILLTLMLLSPAMVLGCTVIVYVWMGNELSVVFVFTTWAFVQVIQNPLNMLTWVASEVIQAHVSTKRIAGWLKEEEIYPHVIRELPKEEPKRKCAGLVCIQEGNFAYGSSGIGTAALAETKNTGKETKGESETHVGPLETSPNSQYIELSDVKEDREKVAIFAPVAVLKSINLRVKPGALCAIVGPVGCGKTSLFHAILGELNQLTGTTIALGKIAYVGQESWIPHGELRSNILFESGYNPKKYNKVVRATQLQADISALPAGDRTEIGEKGINLSGGQKARVSLARAIYREGADIYLLDDPLSAVDAHVARKIFDEALNGMLKGKTRILVLNSHYHLLQSVDQVVVMSNGEIVSAGSPRDLVARFPEYLQVREEDEEAEISHDEVSREVLLSSTAGRAMMSSTDGTHLASVVVSQLKVEQAGALPNDNVGRLVMEEDREFGAVTAKVYLDYFRAGGRWGIPWAVILLLLVVLAQSVSTINEWWLGIWGNDQYGLGRSTYLYIFLGLSGAAAIFIALKTILFITALMSISRNIHDKVFKSVLHAPVTTFFDVTPIGRLMNRFSKDMDMLDMNLPEFLSELLTNVAAIIAALIIACASQPFVVLTLIPPFIAYAIFQNFFRKSSREMKRLESISRTPIFSHFGETLSGVTTIRAFAMENTFLQKSRNAVNNNTRHVFAYNMSGRWLALRLDLVAITVLLAVTLLLVAFKGSGSSVNPVIAGLAVQYTLMLTGLLQWTVRTFIMFENSMTSVERILYLGDIQQEQSVIEPPTKIESDPQLISVSSSPNSTVSALKASWKAEEKPETSGTISFENVYMKYRPELELVLKGVDLRVRGGEKIGICGRTGAGKSSIMLALYRFVELEYGRITIDGVDISAIPLQQLRSILSIIPQDPVMFCGTLRYNLDPFERCTDEEIWDALRKVHLVHSLQNNNKGLLMDISESGENLSMGQRQLICIARALLMKTDILIMDEATASVDTNTDAMIQRTVRDNFGNRTVLCIAHRLETIMDSDRIAVVSAGKIAECDAPRKLLEDPDSEFTKLAQHLGAHMVMNLKKLLVDV